MKKKNVESLQEKILENVSNDRKTAEDLLINIKNFIIEKFEELNGDGYGKVMMSAAKMVETLQKSNEQVLRIVEIESKKKDKEDSTQLSKEELEKIWKEEVVESNQSD